MNEPQTYSVRTVFDGMKGTFHRYLEAQYHIWNESLIAERKGLLETAGVTFQEPRIEATPTYVAGPNYAQMQIPAAAKAVLELAARQPGTGIPDRPYKHQADSLEAFLGRAEEVIVATGTGSGKTECFLMPILGSLAVESGERPNSWLRPGCRALLLYPMNALVNDQISRLRRLLGQNDVAEHIRGARPSRATFGMYTSHTPYPGKQSRPRDQSRLRPLVQHDYLDLPEEARRRLNQEGKWPAKDLDGYVVSSFKTGPRDSEMLSRNEMQTRCPDLLVTNYSMLEYMLLRPIERSIFEQTAAWLATDKSNVFTVVLDEAHMYRGSGGAEVAYLLRRLHARLGVPRDRVKYILTSASLGKSAEAVARMKSFAADLSGLGSQGREFMLIKGEQLKKTGECPATTSEAAALAAYDITTLHNSVLNPVAASEGFGILLDALGQKPPASQDNQAGLQQVVYEWLQSFGPAALITNEVTAQPRQLREVARLAFPSSDKAAEAMEAMLALMSFAKEKDSGRVFAPVRSHMFFRGLAGIFACVDPTCTERGTSGRAILGKTYSMPMLRCACGSRVYEVLTHRDCGAAFIRGYVQNELGKFLWHQPSTGLWGEGGLVEAHFLVEVDRRAHGNGTRGRMEGTQVWLHKATGQLVVQPPSVEVEPNQYLALLRPDGLVPVSAGQRVLSFDKKCPVCTRHWHPGTTKIMDLATKGEAPFAQLIRTQVELQPITQQKSDNTPNGGRKSLLFSDGRQKAARLARDIPREIENDVFRQLLLLAAQELRGIGREATLGVHMYVALLHVLAKNSLFLFDGADREQLQRDVLDHRRYYQGQLKAALEEPPSKIPPRFNSLLLRHLGSAFYSVSALTLAHIVPVTQARRQIVASLPKIEEVHLQKVWTAWIQSFASKFSVDANLPQGVRSQAAGYSPGGGLDKNGGFSAPQKTFLHDRMPNLDQIFDALKEALCQPRPGSSGFFIDPRRIALELASEQCDWYQCGQCATVSPVEWWGHCPNCLAGRISAVRPDSTQYLRARKAFFRDPANDILQGRATPFNLSVEEHTAQLSYRDVDDSTSTTEKFERRFRDILVTPTDTSIDVLSSTTTMEVGIDIGSLVAVGLRNVPPLRQNYQQRAGRAGRRGSAVSTVVTYAQNSPHDNHYFENPELIISGEPTLPGVDTQNPKIIERHICAQLIQAFFHAQMSESANGDVFAVLGETIGFYSGSGLFSLAAFEEWIANAQAAKKCLTTMRQWLPDSFKTSPTSVAMDFVQRLKKVRPANVDELDPAEKKLIEFLFARGFLPSYAFPRNLCALQIEELKRQGNSTQPNVVQRPQQGLNVALSEYAPGRFVVVDKKTYRVGTVAANGSSAVIDRAARLFAERRFYVHCPKCQFTPGFQPVAPQDESCPLCHTTMLQAAAVIEPQVVFPEGGKEVDEFGDEQVFTNATSAQLSLSTGDQAFELRKLGIHSDIGSARDQQLVMVNKGEEDNSGQYPGFLVCNRCGKTSDPRRAGPHARDYLLATRSPLCTGQFERVYLGYSFASDVLVVRLPLARPLRFDPVQPTERQPIANALQSLAEAFVLGISQELDIDIREINAGFRFIHQGDDNLADIFVYDTLFGGAGYATQARELFSNVMTRAETLLSRCRCSSSCDKCLRHYGNRFHHSILDRHLALDLLRFIRDGALPDRPSLDEQRSALKPLCNMMKLAGWSMGNSPVAPYAVVKEGRRIELFSFPSLVDPKHCGYAPASDRFAFSPFELSRDLPGAFGEITK
ncbi:DEAD/DEAH box helicase [Verminephrobacter eiseniae]|uniref:DEAD/DEAH box helicase n=1 Tax=Verminephrobacter eiseniae TaxID=364317 RepID=UPI002237A3AB|nr:DEAD/DEAH box helicase [Verminephrobacter eiseniae]MCW5232493.1 DEAD/DEAH box helicase [Verminephrobacter eiseniae]MCW5295941.1 DEAD/DEAH box helicase [Verminephrobacter eiseniae]MCW8184014.1 DEAD/DEAH box helicase [Verminephrobacter eiseniae]MCW8221592.1 DEAD/DEAH box helicase [Verminephrobacter eiseniae]MCW8232631.1 DEAD/DEAH box helicase [Verminephrobacter eiseniae]